jgi:hypothetical protein
VLYGNHAGDGNDPTRVLVGRLRAADQLAMSGAVTDCHNDLVRD